MKEKVKFVYFDIGGVFFDWSKVFSKAAKDFGVTVKEIDDVFEEYDEDVTKGRIDAQEFWMKCVGKLKIKNAENYDFLESWIYDYVPIPETHKLVKDLSEKYKIGVISNIYKGMYPLLVKTGKIPNVNFGVKILSCDVGMRKPDREIYKLAQRKAGAKDGEILFIDDSKSSIEGAKKLGWQTVFFDSKNIEKVISKIENTLE